MSQVIQQSELRNDNASVMRRVQAGESFVVTVNGHPVADVVPHQGVSNRKRFVPVAQVKAAFESTPVQNLNQWLLDIDAQSELLGPDKPSDPFEAGRSGNGRR